MTRAYDVVVVGGGVMGAATARALALRGRRVCLLERFQTGHARGSSHGTSRIFRFSYADPRYVRMAMDALPLWRRVEAEAGRPLLTTTGGIDLGAAVADHAEALRSAGARFEIVNPGEVARRFGLIVEEDALFQPDAGHLDAEGSWRALLAGAANAGAEIQERTPATGFRPGATGVRVDTAAGPIHAATCVVTAGAWARPLLSSAGIDLAVRPTRETVAYFRVREAERLLPVVAWGDPAVYALPAPGDGLKAGEHRAGPETDPEADGTPDPRSIERLARWVRSHIAGVSERAHRAETCLYTNTADGHFVLERRGPVVIGSPCSGHGFKFAPLIGERLAALAEEAI